VGTVLQAGPALLIILCFKENKSYTIVSVDPNDIIGRSSGSSLVRVHCLFLRGSAPSDL
jgi:hypothetical protein